MTFLHSRQDALTTELSSLGVTPYRWDPRDRKWIGVITQLAHRCGQEGRCSTCTCPHRPVTVVNRLIPTEKTSFCHLWRLQLVILLCLLPSEVILTVCYVKMFPHIGENGSVTEHTTHQNLPYSDTFPSYLRKRNPSLRHILAHSPL